MAIQRLLFIAALFGCVPKIEKGPVPIDEAAKPVQILQMSDPNSPNIYIQAFIQTGSAMDPTGQEGLAHYTAKGMIGGGAASWSAEAFRNRLYTTGNEFKLVVDREYTSIRLRCHLDHADLCLETFLAALTQPTFENEAMARISEEALYHVTEGILSNEEALGDEVLNTVLYEGHPYGHPVAGRGGTLALLTPEYAKSFHATQYLRSTVRVGIGGGFNDTHLQTLQDGLQLLSTKMAPDRALQSPVRVTGRQLIVISTDTPVTGFHLGHNHVVTRGHEDWPALYLATLAFGAHRQSSGRLFESLRTQRGLNYGDYAYTEAFTQFGGSTFPEQGVTRRLPMFYLWLRPTSIANGPFALKLALSELEQWVEHGLEDEEFQTVKKYALGHLPLEAQNIGRRLSYALNGNISETPNLLETLPAKLEELTLEQVNAAVRRHITPDNLIIVSVSGEGSELVERLKAGQTTPIQYMNVTPGPEQAKKDADIAVKELGIQFDQVEVREAKGLFR